MEEVQIEKLGNSVKLSEDMLKAFRARATALNSANVLIQMAQAEFEMFKGAVVQELKLEKDKKYNFDLNKGIVLEVKEEEVKLNGAQELVKDAEFEEVK